MKEAAGNGAFPNSRCGAGPKPRARFVTAGYLTADRNVPTLGLLKAVERFGPEVVLQIITAIAVLALLLYLMFGPSN